MLVVPVSMAAVVPLESEMTLPWTVNAGYPISCRSLLYNRQGLTCEIEKPVVRSARDINVIDRTRVQAAVGVS